MQFRENLGIAKRRRRFRARIDWKYLLSLRADGSGFRLFDPERIPGPPAGGERRRAPPRQAAGALPCPRSAQGPGAAAHRLHTRARRCPGAQPARTRGGNLRAALNAVATVAPDWLQAVTPLAWYERYSRRIEESRLPKDTAAREAYAHTVGEDGFMLLDAVETPEAPAGLRELPRMEALRRTWQRHYERPACEPASPGAPPSGGCVSRRAATCRRPPRASNRPTMSRRATATNATRRGRATWCMSAKRANQLPRICSRTCTRRRGHGA